MTWIMKPLPIFFLLALHKQSQGKENITLGLLVPWTGTWNRGRFFASAITIAVDDINNDPTLLPNHHLDFVWADSGCRDLTASGLTVELVRKGVKGIIGPSCSRACLGAGYLASYYQLPMISYSCSSVELSDKEIYYTFARTKPFGRTSELHTPKIFLRIMKHFGWQRICIAESHHESYSPVADATRKYLIKNNITIMRSEKFAKDGFDPDYYARVLAPTCRVILFICWDPYMSKIIFHGRKYGMDSGTYVFIKLDMIYLDTYFASMNKLFGITNSRELHTGIINVQTVQVNQTAKRYKILEAEAERRLALPPFNYVLKPGEVMREHIAYVYDATKLMAYAMNKSLAHNNTLDGLAVASFFNKVTFEGYSGKVQIDENGDRVPLLEWKYFNYTDMVRVAEYDPADDRLTWLEGAPQRVFPAGATVAPRDMPPCGFWRELCPPVPLDYSAYVYAAAALIMCSVISGAIYGIRRQQFRTQYLTQELIIPFESITLQRNMESRKLSNLSHCSALTEKGGVSTKSFAYFKGDSAHIQQVPLKETYKVRTNIQFSTVDLIELKKLKDIVHININPFLGISVHGDHLYILSSFCSKGSLMIFDTLRSYTSKKNVLKNENFDCGWMFKMSFSNDIATGMKEIHRSVLKHHGNLTSSNVVIDARWVCKLTNFGLSPVYDNFGSAMSKDTTEGCFWTAPELLNEEKNSANMKQCDVYSFGIILHEIGSRCTPYEDELLSNEEILNKVRARNTPPFRPTNDLEHGAPLNYLPLMEQCWNNDPGNRPPFSSICKQIREMAPKLKSGSLVDNMLSMMEKYADDLEKIVEERTEQLKEEKIKSETLLYKMLPQSVAKELVAGRPVPAERFDEVTVFFSDIVGFTKLASESTPFEIVVLLNDLYSCFDRVIDEFDVYKVETIGDAYMVVSGLPVKNGSQHAGEIATMSLELLHCVGHFEIRHKPDTKLQLRVGIHSGCCVAGVVALKMPRYCLFGDTINTASRMESNGLALRIHVSLECKQVLEKLGGYVLEERGLIEMKGKGTVLTFFLNGKRGFNKSLPL